MRPAGGRAKGAAEVSGRAGGRPAYVSSGQGFLVSIFAAMCENRSPALHSQKGKVWMSEKKPSPLSFEVTRKGTTAIVKCNGRLVAGVNDLLHAQVHELLPDNKRIIL